MHGGCKGVLAHPICPPGLGCIPMYMCAKGFAHAPHPNPPPSLPAACCWAAGGWVGVGALANAFAWAASSCTCRCAQVGACTHTCTRVHTLELAPMCVHVDMHVCMHLHVCTYMHMRCWSCLQATGGLLASWAHAHAHAHVGMCTCQLLAAGVCACIHVQVYVHVCMQGQ